LALATLARRHLGDRLGAVAGAVFFTTGMCWSQMTRAGTDTSVVLYASLAVSGLLDWASSERAGDLRRAGIMAGLAGGSKIMALLVPTLVGLGVLLILPRRRLPLGRAGGAGVSFGVVALVLLSPWYVRNLVETGNPLYPFGQSVFAGRNWSNQAAAYLDLYYDQYRTTEASQRGGKPYQGAEVARFPWDLTMHPESFEKGKRQGQDTSPWTLAFIPALVLLRERRREALTVAAIGAGYVAIIAVGAWAHPRYVLPGLALLIAAATPAARALCGRWVFCLVVAVTVGGNLLLVSRMLRPMWPDHVRVAFGPLPPVVFLSRYSDRYVFRRQANQAIPATGSVLVFEKIPHPYFIERPYVLLSYLEQGLVDYRNVTTVDALGDAARRLGATHVSVDEDDLKAAGDPYEAEVTKLWRAFLERSGPPVLRAGGFALYALPPRAAEGSRGCAPRPAGLRRGLAPGPRRPGGHDGHRHHQWRHHGALARTGGSRPVPAPRAAADDAVELREARHPPGERLLHATARGVGVRRGLELDLVRL